MYLFLSKKQSKRGSGTRFNWLDWVFRGFGENRVGPLD